MKTYANVGWTPGDVQTLAPKWSEEKCIEWLEANAKHIQDALVSHGWEVLESLIPTEEKGLEEWADPQLTEPQSKPESET